jgi:dephospho-CoA kinase
VAYVIAVSGLAGSGKTTAITFLARLCGGEPIYLGGTILDVVRDRNLPQTRESERIVRIELREQHGPAVLVKLNAEVILRRLDKGIPVLVDAIFNIEELDLLQSVLAAYPLYLISMSSSFELRYQRLQSRSERPFSEAELRARDQTELETLGTARVLAAATYSIANEGPLEGFHHSLENIQDSIQRALTGRSTGAL